MRGSERETAILISGGGTTAEAVIRACQRGEIVGINPAVVISSRYGAGGLARAEALGIATEVIRKRDYGNNSEAFGEGLLGLLRRYGVEFVSQNGWLVKTPEAVVEEYWERIINQHPGSLDPGRGVDFGGKGMYGARVVCARVAYGWLIGEKEPWTEATVHKVTKEYDEGDLIRVEKLEFEGFDEPVTIAQLGGLEEELKKRTKEVQRKLLPLEHKNVIKVLKMFGGQEIVGGDKREERLIPEENIKSLNLAKGLAVNLFPKG